MQDFFRRQPQSASRLKKNLPRRFVMPHLVGNDEGLKRS